MAQARDGCSIRLLLRSRGVAFNDADLYVDAELLQISVARVALRHDAGQLSLYVHELAVRESPQELVPAGNRLRHRRDAGDGRRGLGRGPDKIEGAMAHRQPLVSPTDDSGPGSRRRSHIRLSARATAHLRNP